jgi:YD repeat-containing protein
VVLSSCHKGTGQRGPRLISAMHIDGNPCVINCTYDNQKRVTSVIQCDTMESYNYYKDSVVYLYTVSNGFFFKHIYALNDKGITTGYTKVASDGSVTNYTFTYDADGNRTNSTDITHGNTFVNYTIQNSNAVYDSSVSALIGSGNYTVSRIFYANTENTISYANFGKAFLGSSSANFKKAESYNTTDGQYVINYTYELDPQNGVSRRIMKVNDSIIESRSYEYLGSD